MIAKLKPLGTIVLEALTTKWWAAAIVIVLGAIVAIRIADVPPGFLQPMYVAKATVSFAKLSVTNVSFDCTAANAPGLMKRPDILQAAEAQAPLDRSSILTTPIGTIADITYTAPDRSQSSNAAQALGTSLATWCRTQTVAAWQIYNDKLTQKKTLLAQQISSLERTLIPAAQRDAHLKALQSQLKALDADRVAAVTQQATLQKTADAAQAQLLALEPVASSENAANDATFKAMKAQLDKDGALAASMAANYKSTYPPLLALQQKVVAEQDALVAQSTAIARREPVMLSPTYRAAALLHFQALANVEAQENAVVAIDVHITQVKRDIAASNGDPVATAAVQREHDTLVTGYNTVAAALNLAQVEEGILPADGPAAVLAPPEQPVVQGSWRVLLATLLVFAVFVVLGLALSVLLYRIDHRLLTASSVTELYGRPVIATVKAPDA